jgi:hypothetical protein
MLPKQLLGQASEKEVFTHASLGGYLSGTMTEAAFMKLIGSVFTAFSAKGVLSHLTLQAVQDNAAQGEAAVAGAAKNPVRPSTKTATTATSGFSLSFLIAGAPIKQGTYLLDHGTMGSFAVFLVPGGEGHGPETCAAVFNYVANPSARTIANPAKPGNALGIFN